MSTKRRKKFKEEKTMENTNTEIITNEEIVTPEITEELVETTQEVVNQTNEEGNTLTEETETVEKVEETTEDVEEVKPLIGRIHGFDKLYVRKEANKESDPAGIVESTDDLIIDLENSTDEFYKVRTESGLDGYCVKDYIKID